MKDKKEKNIFKRIFRRIAAIFSAGAVTLTLAACENTNENAQEENIQPQNVFCDTSDINLNRYIEQYIADYEAGTISDGIEMLNYYDALYEDLREDREIEKEEKNIFGKTVKTETEIITYNFDIQPMFFDTLENGIYYSNGESIKEVTSSSVQLKTLAGSIKIENIPEAYCITNVDESRGTTTIIQYNSDGSYTISENENNQNQTFEFDEDGMLVLSEEAQYDENGKKGAGIKKEHKNGDIESYSVIEERKEDGSYIIFEYDDTIDEERYNFYSDSNRQNNYRPGNYDSGYDKISYYYDENDELKKIETNTKERTNNWTEYYIIFSPNGDYYEYIKMTNEDGEITNEQKIENIYNKYRTREEKKKNEKGEFDVYVSKFDYSLLPSDPYISNGDTIFSSKNGTILVQEKDGIIYQYGQDGEFWKAYNVVEDGINYYREDGSLSRFEDNNGKKTEYNEDGKIYSITEDTLYTRYYDYEQNSISYISNQSDDEITAEYQGKKYKLLQGGSVSFDENGNLKYYRLDKNTCTTYHENGEIWVIEKDGIETTYEDYANNVISSINKDGIYTKYYDYANNLIEQTCENGISTFFYRNNQIKLMRNGNYRDGVIISVNDIFGNIYEIDEGDEIEFNENGTVKSIKEAEVSEYKEFGENYPNFRNISSAITTYYGYDENGNMYITSKREENYTYKKEGTQVLIDQSYKQTYYRDYENNLIHSIDEKDRYTYYYKDTDQSCYYVKNKNDESFTVYRNGEVLYESNGTEKIYSGSTGFIIVLEDGSQISSKAWDSEDEIENVQEVEDDGR